MPNITRYEFEYQLLAKAFSDPSFMKLLNSDPKSAVEQVLGSSLPAGVKVKLLVEDSSALYAVMPNAAHTALGSLGTPSQPLKSAREQTKAKMISALTGNSALMTRFRADPTGTMNSMLPAPSGLQVKTFDEPPDTVYIVLPFFGRDTYTL